MRVDPTLPFVSIWMWLSALRSCCAFDFVRNMAGANMMQAQPMFQSWHALMLDAPCWKPVSFQLSIEIYRACLFPFSLFFIAFCGRHILHVVSRGVFASFSQFLPLPSSLLCSFKWGQSYDAGEGPPYCYCDTEASWKTDTQCDTSWRFQASKVWAVSAAAPHWLEIIETSPSIAARCKLPKTSFVKEDRTSIIHMIHMYSAFIDRKS
jgi:hypothetical protein